MTRFLSLLSFITGFTMGLLLGLDRARTVVTKDITRLYCDRIEDRAAYQMCADAIRETLSREARK